MRAFIKSNKCDYNVRDRKGRVPAEDCSNPDIISMLIEAATSPTGLPKRYDGGYDGRFGRVGAQRRSYKNSHLRHHFDRLVASQGHLVAFSAVMMTMIPMY